MASLSQINLDTITLDKGSHRNPDEGACLLELVALFAGEPFSDRPSCVSPVLRDFGINLNDRWDDEQRQKLKPFVPRLIGTAGDGQDEARGYLALDWLIRTLTPAWLDLAGLNAEAAELRALRRIVDLAAAQVAGPVVRNAQRKAAAAWDAAWAAAWAAAGDAAWDAARAARDAARAAAATAAATARAAARAALQPTVKTLQASALDLLDRMIDPSAVTA